LQTNYDVTSGKHPGAIRGRRGDCVFLAVLELL
jgi:hypothetical protein